MTSSSSPPQGPTQPATHDDRTPVDTEEGPKYPWTLAPPTYQQGLESRILMNLVPVFEPFFESLQKLPHPVGTPSRILELASGNGTHVLLYAQNFPPLASEGTEGTEGRGVVYQPTECDTYNCKLVDDKTQGVEVGWGRTIKKCRRLDLLIREDWEGLNDGDGQDGEVDQGDGWDLVLGHNFIHMVPCPQCPTILFQRLRPQMRPQGKLLIYGPMKSDQGYFSENDEKFDSMIQSRPGSEGIGLRSIQHLGRLAQENGWTLEKQIGVVMGNWVLVFVVKE